MKKILLLTSFLFTICLNGFGQSTPKQGTADYLLVKNGFKIFKLGTDINNYSKYVKFDRNNEDGTKEYKVTDPKFLSVGRSIQLKSIVLKTYGNKILSVSVIANDKSNFDFFQTLQAAYGEIPWGVRPEDNIYTWETKNKAITLYYNDRYKDKEDIYDTGLAVFVDNNISAFRDNKINNEAYKNANDM